MRIFTPQVNQKIVIGDSITITILEVTEDEVCFGIDAPPGTNVVPAEHLQLALDACQSVANAPQTSVEKTTPFLTREQ
ncbi:MAG: carbon storage regulator [Gemmataceae bacterium]